MYGGVCVCVMGQCDGTVVFNRTCAHFCPLHGIASWQVFLGQGGVIQILGGCPIRTTWARFGWKGTSQKKQQVGHISPLASTAACRERKN